MRHALTSIIVIAVLALLVYVAWRGLAVMKANTTAPAKTTPRVAAATAPVTPPTVAPVAPAPPVVEPPAVAASVKAPVAPRVDAVASKPHAETAAAPAEQKPAPAEPPPPVLPPAHELVKAWLESPPTPPPEGSDPSPSPPPQSMHKELSAQERDENWSDAAEAELRDYFGYMVRDDWVEILSVYCGTESCEIQAATRSPETLSADIEDWQQLIASMPQQPWWSSHAFSDPTTSSNVTTDGRALFAAFVKRTPASEAAPDGG